MNEEDIITLESKDEFLMPGFIDSHIHASQFPNLGTLKHDNHIGVANSICNTNSRHSLHTVVFCIDAIFSNFYILELGLGLDSTLLDWLEKYTFPLESKFADTDFARRVYNSVVHATLNGGTTTAAYFATIHRPASEILCDIAEERRQRALVGKVTQQLCNLFRTCVST